MSVRPSRQRSSKTRLGIWAAVAVWIALDAWLAQWWWKSRQERRAEIHVAAAARQYAVEPALVKAVIWRESRFRENARGAVGELGLMQIGRLAAKEWAEAEKVATPEGADLLDPVTNTKVGTWYLARLLRRYRNTDDPEPYALADYNAGRVNVLRWIRGQAATNSTAFLAAIDFPTTREYVRSVLAKRAEYRTRFRVPR